MGNNYGGGGGGAKLQGVDMNEAVNLELRNKGMDFNEGVSDDRLGKRKEIILGIKESANAILDL